MSHFSFLSFFAFIWAAIIGTWRLFYNSFCGLLKKWRGRLTAASPFSWKPLMCAGIFLRRILAIRFVWNGSIFMRLASIH